MLAITSGARDIDRIPLDKGEDETEVYWDVILLTESQLLLPAVGGGELGSKQVYKGFQKHIVKRIGESLSRIVRQKKSTQDNPSTWRSLGATYYMVYLPLYFSDIIWCKSGSIYFHVFLPGSSQSVGDKKQSNEKEWLLALLELASSFDCQFLRLYLRRDDKNGVLTFLRNLNWIGGRLVPNEDRNQYIINSPSNDSSVQDMLLGDESFVILEFEC